MLVQFSKYHGTGNDFILIDQRRQELTWLSQERIAALCHRRFGIGSDGLILLQNSKQSDFRMRYYNADGREGSMCGNGGRCLVAFAHRLGLCGAESRFEGIDGLHQAFILENKDIRQKMKDVDGVTVLKDGFLLDTGSPHFVRFADQLDQLPVEIEGRKIRHEPRFAPDGVNVNFAQKDAGTNIWHVRTFERGVEAETWSCGTGVTAAAICAYLQEKTDKNSYLIHTRGGSLHVEFEHQDENRFRQVYLTGPALHVYDGAFEA